MFSINNLAKSFGENRILKNINLTIMPNRTTVIIGPSGSGKTTLLRCINLLELPNAGELNINGEVLGFNGTKVNKKDILNLRKKTGMVFQSFNLFPHKTALGNIIEGPITVLKQPKEEAVAQAMKLLKKIGLEDKKDSYPHELSGGQQQRIAIARALSMKPEILLFDEPTSALDPELEIEVLSLIKELAEENYTIVIVTHKMSFARDVGDNIVFIDQGEIIEQGTYEKLNESPNTRIRQFLNTFN
ncbi:amino acid ABC transporter ATP-binding protein [Cellulosilyticum sp. I15G10I2]|uniref:amino acid ABC transporter ATP-binding protein n=1 Tax=Cellulosilyticum sp. I15G10I2 TaxID=1892843 RepID=UPI00085C4B9D|nr:amino acid ABC transporter ATP-binding protein [Cellulosilyticum sp. I15G10I2]